MVIDMFEHTHLTPVHPNRVVVLGGSGFIGTHLVKQVGRSGIEVLSISSSKIDLATPEAIRALAETVRHDDTLVFASCLTRDKSEDLPTLMKNLTMAENVGLFLENHGCGHLIYLSSDAVYKDEISLVREDSVCEPSGLYGMTHVVRERMMAYSAAKAGIPLAILRPCGVYGAGDTHNGYGPNRFLRTALSQQKISLFGQGEETRDHIFVGDVCRLIELCARHKSMGTLNLATGRAYSFAEVAELVSRAVSKPVKIEYLPRRTPVTHKHFDVTAVLKTFSSVSATSLEVGLRQTVRDMAGVLK